LATGFSESLLGLDQPAAAAGSGLPGLLHQLKRCCSICPGKALRWGSLFSASRWQCPGRKLSRPWLVSGWLGLLDSCASRRQAARPARHPLRAGGSSVAFTPCWHGHEASGANSGLGASGLNPGVWRSVWVLAQARHSLGLVSGPGLASGLAWRGPRPAQIEALRAVGAGLTARVGNEFGTKICGRSWLFFGGLKRRRHG